MPPKLNTILTSYQCNRVLVYTLTSKIANVAVETVLKDS